MDGGSQEAFTSLTKHLTEAPILAYPDFSRDFVLETDALGLGGVLSHEKEDGKLRLIVYASRSLPTQEKNIRTIVSQTWRHRQ